MPKKIYLAGGVNGLTRDEATGWRDYATYQLAIRNMEAIDPLRGRKHHVEVFNGSEDYDSAEIVVRDKQDILCCDALLVEYVHPDRNYAGTSMEILYGYEHHKPIVVWSEHGWKSYWMRYHATVILPELLDCIDYLAKIW